MQFVKTVLRDHACDFKDVLWPDTGKPHTDGNKLFLLGVKESFFFTSYQINDD